MEGPHARTVPALMAYERLFHEREAEGRHLVEQDALNVAADLDEIVWKPVSKADPGGGIWAPQLRRGIVSECDHMGRAFRLLHRLLVREVS